MIIGDRIKQLRELNGMTQQELADKIGSTRQAISAWEQNRALPRIGAVEKLSQAFHCTKDELIGADFLISTQATTDQEIILLSDFRLADAQTKEMVLRMLHLAGVEANNNDADQT